MEKKNNIRTIVAPAHKNALEQEAWQQGDYVCGIDEVGRGCLAGPLVTAAVILPLNKTSRLLRDSKILTEEERYKGALWIAKHCWYAYGIINNRFIDRHNIYQSTLICMKKALVNLLAQSPKPSAILVDAMPLKLGDTGYIDIPVHYFCKGEQKSSSIAAASIMAKIKRDEIMQKYNELFPGFCCDEHKGYGTRKHQEFLRNNPPLIIHRSSFLQNLDLFGNTRKITQQQNLIIFT